MVGNPLLTVPLSVPGQDAPPTNIALQVILRHLLASLYVYASMRAVPRRGCGSRCVKLPGIQRKTLIRVLTQDEDHQFGRVAKYELG